MVVSALLLQVVVLLEQLFLSSPAFFQLGPQPVDSQLSVDDHVLMEGVLRWISELERLDCRWIVDDLGRIMDLRDGPVVDDLLFLPLGGWRFQLLLGLSSCRNIDDNLLRLLGMIVLRPLLLPIRDLLIEPSTFVPHLVLEVLDELIIQGRGSKILLGLELVPPSFIFCHVRDKLPDEFNIIGDIL